MRSTVVDTTCGPVEYSEAGGGEPVLYFHGTGVAGQLMLAVESLLVDDGCRLIVPNRPGYGRTPLSANRSAAQCANLTAALLDALGIGNVSVMGSSGGAAFAAAFAIAYPSRTKSLVLLCPQVHRWDHKRWLPATSRWTLPLLKRPLFRKLLLKLYRFQLQRMTVTQFLKVEAGERYADVVANPATLALCETTLAAMRLSTKCPGFENDFVVFTSEDIIRSDNFIQTPTLIIHDEADPVAPREHVDWLMSMCQDCKRVSVRAAGHLIWVGPDAGIMHRMRVQFLKGF